MTSAAVLLSGGPDSALALVRALDAHEDVHSLFFEYGQPYVDGERAAIRYLTEERFPQLHHRTVQLPPMTMQVGGEFKRRNVVFLNHVLDVGDWDAVYIGLRGFFDTYPDTGLEWLDAARRYTGATIHAPALMLPKFFVRRGLRRANVDVTRLFSSEGYREEGEGVGR